MRSIHILLIFDEKGVSGKKGVSTVDPQALKDVQSQLDVLVEQLIQAKIMLAGFAIGADKVWSHYNISNSSEEEYEISE